MYQCSFQTYNFLGPHISVQLLIGPMVFILVDCQHVKPRFSVQWLTVAGQGGIKVICDGKFTNLFDFAYSYFLAKISWLSHHYVMHTSRPRGICLLINNVPTLVVGEEKLKDLFEFLSFDVLIKRGLQREEIYSLAEEFAKKDHTHFDTFVVIFMSFCGRCSEISCADGRNASLEHIMEEFRASRCPSLRGKPKLFFVQRFRGTSSRVNNEYLFFESGSFAEKDAMRMPCIPASERDSCPEEADFLLVGVTSTYPADQPIREPASLFIQVKDQSSFVTQEGGEGRLRILRGITYFLGGKDGGQSSLTGQNEGLLKINCQWGRGGGEDH